MDIAIVRWEGRTGESAVGAVCDGSHIYERGSFGVVYRHGRDGMTRIDSWKIPPEICEWLRSYAKVREVPEQVQH